MSTSNQNAKRCEAHNKVLYYCQPCGGGAYCACNGGKQRKTFCVIHKGKGLCPHNKQKAQCGVCKGSSYCKEHGKKKATCKECNGSQICQIEGHGLQRKSVCKECGYGVAVSLCEHNLQKYHCRTCKGSALCDEHNIRKMYCKECPGGATGFCEHDIRKVYCRQCGGASSCVHKNRKSYCQECNGSSYCSHGKFRDYCSECDGKQICAEHRVPRFNCIPCHGSQICPVYHRQKQYCKHCDGSKLCKAPLCEKQGIPKYEMFCLTCCIHLRPDIQVSRNYKTKEKDVTDRIKEEFKEFDWTVDRRIYDGCSKRRPDILADFGTHLVIIEIDENRHNDYDCSCENKRLMELSQDLNHRPIVVIRFNPDDYKDENGKKVKSCWKADKNGVLKVFPSQTEQWNNRVECLKEHIHYWTENVPGKMIEIIELFY